MALGINGANSLNVGERFGGAALSLSTTTTVGVQAKPSTFASEFGFTNPGSFSMPAGYWHSDADPSPWNEMPIQGGWIASTINGSGSVQATPSLSANVTGTGSVVARLANDRLTATVYGTGSVFASASNITTGFTSIDNIIKSITASTPKTKDVFFQKVCANTVTTTANNWYEFLTASGIPSAMSLTGTAGVATALTSTTAGAFPLNSSVSPAIRSLMNVTAWASATQPPMNLIVCDFLLLYPNLSPYSAGQTILDNTIKIPRYTDGSGVKAIAVVQTAMSLGGNVTINFTAPDDTTQSSYLTTPSDITNVTAMFTRQVNSLSSSTPFFPIPNGKSGIKSIDSYTFANGSSGRFALLLCRPLVQIPITAATNMATMRDCVYQLQSLPQIKDGACLGFISSCATAFAAPATAIMGKIQYGWSD